MSEAQLRLLKSLVDNPRYVASYYRPGQILVQRGFAEWDGPSKNRLLITELGRRYLTSYEPKRI